MTRPGGTVPSHAVRSAPAGSRQIRNRIPAVVVDDLGLRPAPMLAKSAAGLVADTLAFVPIPSSIVVPVLGAVEVVAGIAPVIGRILRPVLAGMAAHLIGTFLVLVTRPAVAFQDGNLLLLTTEGEFVVKNLVLIAGALLVAAALAPMRHRARLQ